MLMVADEVIRAAVAIALDGARRPALVVTDLALDPDDLADAVVVGVGAAPFEGHFRTTLLVAADAASLRRAAARLGDLGRARMVGCVAGEADAAIVPRAHPGWPAVTDLDARLVERAAVTRLELAERTPAAPVLAALARAAARPVPAGHGGLRAATTYAVDDEVPPDVLLTTGALPVASPVTGRAPLVVTDLDEPLDEAVYNPVGFRREWERGMVTLPADVALSPTLIKDLRDAQGVHLPPEPDPDLVRGLAMCGVPTVEIADPVERERHSVRVRREALLTHSAFAWRARLAERSGVRLDGGVDTDLELARRYSGADLVVMPEADHGPTECYAAEPPPGEALHDPRRSPADIVAAGGLVYVTHSRAVS